MNHDAITCPLSPGNRHVPILSIPAPFTSTDQPPLVLCCPETAMAMEGGETCSLPGTQGELRTERCRYGDTGSHDNQVNGFCPAGGVTFGPENKGYYIGIFFYGCCSISTTNFFLPIQHSIFLKKPLQGVVPSANPAAVASLPRCDRVTSSIRFLLRSYPVLYHFFGKNVETGKM